MGAIFKIREAGGSEGIVESESHRSAGWQGHGERILILGQTAAAIAHEVRNPLGSMKLMLSLLREDLSGQEGPLSLVDHLEKSMASLDDVVANILYFARHQRLTMNPLNLHSVVREQVSLLEPRLRGAPPKVTLSGSPYIEGNEHGLRQVLCNLLCNAAQATRFSGNIEVLVEDHGLDQIVLRVRDDGPGIPEEVIDTLFEPFVTTRAEGTGLGLSIVAQIVEGHGGTISVENQGGAEFRVSLPRSSRK